MQIPQKENIDVDILGTIEFDLTEAIKDLIWNIKSIKKDVDMLKKHNDYDGVS